MSIFGKKPESEPEPANRPPARPEPEHPSPPSPARPAGRDRSYLGPACELEGEFRGSGSFECSGTFSGSVEVDGEILIGKGGTATATLKGRRIVINGRLEGDAIGGEKVEVGASGHVEGDVRAPAVQFAEGAFFEGNVEMRASRSAGSPPPRAEVRRSGSGPGAARPS